MLTVKNVQNDRDGPDHDVINFGEINYGYV